MKMMTTPLQYGDPPHLGPFVLQARLRAAAAGVVYLGQAPDGRAVSVAVLTRGAARDAAARDRFVSAIREAQRRQRAQPPSVIAMQDGRAPWVAVPYVPGGPGAERFLDPVMVSGTLLGARRGPDFLPHWLGDGTPALPAPPKPAPPVATQRAVVLASALLATLVLVVLVVLWLLLFRGNNEQAPPRPLPATNFVPTPPPEPSPPGPGRPSPSSSPGSTGSRTPLPQDLDDQGEPI